MQLVICFGVITRFIRSRLHYHFANFDMKNTVAQHLRIGKKLTASNLFKTIIIAFSGAENPRIRNFLVIRRGHIWTMLWQTLTCKQNSTNYFLSIFYLYFMNLCLFVFGGFNVRMDGSKSILSVL